MPMFHYVSGVYCYLYFDQMHVNLIWYLYPFMLNKICLSLSLSLCWSCFTRLHLGFLLESRDLLTRIMSFDDTDWGSGPKATETNLNNI